MFIFIKQLKTSVDVIENQNFVCVANGTGYIIMWIAGSHDAIHAGVHKTHYIISREKRAAHKRSREREEDLKRSGDENCRRQTR